MIKVVFICEGMSETYFVNRVLKKYWQDKGLLTDTETIILGVTGGDVRLSRLETDLENILKEDGKSYIPTIFDHCELHSHWPGQELLNEAMTSREKVAIIEQETKKELINRLQQYDVAKLFVPYFMLHEYEGLFFTQPEMITEITRARAATQRLQGIANEFNGEPEEINTEFAPSARLREVGANYGKVTHGHRIMEKIGIDVIRRSCGHFNDWLTVLESLS